MTISDIYRCCSNVEPDAHFHLYKDSGYYREEGGTVYNHFSDLPYPLYVREAVKQFMISEDGFTVHVLIE